MWLSKNMVKSMKSGHLSELTEVSDGSTAAFAGFGRNGKGRYFMASPGGILYHPQSGDRAVVVSTAAGEICTGIIQESDTDIEAGELKLYSSGGASIVLKNDGTVLINGEEV